MNRNSENHFQIGPRVDIQRSTFKMSQDLRTSFNTGLLIPFFVDSDIMPGDTYQVDGTFVIRGTTPIAPTLDNAYADIYWFFDKNNYMWTHWKEFMGENKTGDWAQTTEYTIPQIKFGYVNNGLHSILKGDLADYFGLPLFTAQSGANTPTIEVNALPFRSYVRIWNNFFRNQNLQPPQYERTNDTTWYTIPDTSIDGTNDSWLYVPTTPSSASIQRHPAPVNKYADYFTTCNPSPQKGPAVTQPIGESAPVKILSTNTFGDIDNATLLLKHSTNGAAANYSNNLLGIAGSALDAYGGSVGADTLGADFTIANVIEADLSNAVAATINAQRLAFATQRIYEKSVFGTRYYLELIPNFFGVQVPGAATDLPEYLGGCRIPITQNQVAQTSSTDAVTPQGNVAAFSLTVNGGRQFTKSFTEHGVLMGLICVRTDNSYDQGIERQWSRKRKLDYYWPQLAHLGEQAVLNKEIYADGTAYDEQVFGYQERWAEYKYKPNKNTGAFHTTYATSLDFWHYGDNYSSLPVLQSSWALSNKDAVDRTLAVTSATEDQWLMNARINIKATRPMPMYSMPGLIDHY